MVPVNPFKRVLLSHRYILGIGPVSRGNGYISDHFEFEKDFYLVVIDSHSNWIDVVPTKSMTVSKTIEILRNLFASYGLLETIVSDNGPGFASKEF